MEKDYKRKGYVKIWRSLQDSDFWLKEKFTRAQAWVDLIMLANHKQGFIRKRGIRINLRRGDVGYSVRQLSNRWKWSRGKTLRFLSELCSENEQKMLPQNEPQKNNITSCYHILNYELYQGERTTERTTKRATNGPQTGHKQYQNNNDKNVKNKRSTAKAETFSLPDKEILTEGSYLKIKSDTEKILKKIYEAKIFNEVHAFTNMMRKKTINERAILHVLTRCYIKGCDSGFKDDKEAWAYCTKIMNVENGNYNERDYQKTKN